MPLKESDRKKRGAYYTSNQVATFLAGWALRSDDDSVLDPSYGEGALLAAAARRLSELGADPRPLLIGVEKHSATHKRISADLVGRGEAIAGNLHNRDFFEFEREELGPVTALLGNPPFIRFHRFNGISRRRALERAYEAGVQIAGNASAWAPFLVHAISFLAENGRAAVVLPTELLHARYAAPVLEYIERSFAVVNIVRFKSLLFPDLQQDALLLLADGYGLQHERASLIDVGCADDLAQLCNGIHTEQCFSISDIATRVIRPNEYFLEVATLNLLDDLRRYSHTSPLGQLARVAIGYVAGDSFFHLSAHDLVASGVSRRDVRRVIRSAKDLRGAIFRADDWVALNNAGARNWLLFPRPGSRTRPTTARVIRQGEKLGVQNRQKCASRSPWWRIRNLPQADALVPSLTHDLTRLVHNEASYAPSNALYAVTFKSREKHTSICVSLASHTSLTQLSAELIGHRLGGGALKLNPSDAASLLIPRVTDQIGETQAVRALSKVDTLLRQDKKTAAIELADSIVLNRILGLTGDQVQALRDSVAALVSRRMKQ